MNKQILLFLCVITFGGCSTVMKGSPERPVSVTNDLKATDFAFDETEIEKYRNANGDAKKILRNEIIDARIRAYDIKFGQFEQNLYRFGIGTGIGTDWTSLIISGLVATTGGEATKSALGAANTALIGAKGSVDKQLFLEKSLPAISAQMIAQRTSVLVNIREGLSREVVDYSLFQGLSDLEQYRRAGTLMGALNGIVKTAGDETQANEEEISNIIKRKYVRDTASDSLLGFWKPNKVLNPQNEQKIKNWMKLKGLDTSKSWFIGQFVAEPQFADLRVEAVNYLKLK